MSSLWEKAYEEFYRVVLRESEISQWAAMRHETESNVNSFM